MDVREKLVELQKESVRNCDPGTSCLTCSYRTQTDCMERITSDFMIANGVTVQEWIPAIEPPKENGYYLCMILFSAVGTKKEYRRKILFWEDNVWIEMANCFRTVKPLYWMPLPEPPKENDNVSKNSV